MKKTDLFFPTLLLSFCPGFGQDGFNFHRNPGRGTAGRAGPTWPDRAGYSIPCAVMLGSGGGELGRGELTCGSGARCCGGGRGEQLFCAICFVLCIPLICIVVVPVPFAVLLNCPYPDPPFSACFFPFSSAPWRGEGRPCGAFVAGRSQTITPSEMNVKEAACCGLALAGNTGPCVCSISPPPMRVGRRRKRQNSWVRIRIV